MKKQVKEVYVPSALIVGIKDKHIVIWGYTKYWCHVHEFMKCLSVPI